MAIRFFFTYDGTVVQLPVNPEEVTVTSSGNNKTEEIISVGQINILRSVKLSECKIKSFFPINSDGSYVLTKGKFKGPQFYIDFFEKIRKDKRYCQFNVSDTDISMKVSIEDFSYSMISEDSDIHFELKLKEYRTYSARAGTISIPAGKTTPVATVASEPRAVKKTGFSIGDTVIVNGKYWYTSYGDSPFGTFNNFTGKISHIVADKSRKFRYHITTTSGGYRGWVSESQIKHA